MADNLMSMILNGRMSVNGSESREMETLGHGMAKMEVSGVKALPETASHVIGERKKFKKAKKVDDGEMNLQQIVAEIIEERPTVRELRKDFRRIGEFFQAEKDARDMDF